jgi:hypothetical protein
VIGMPVSRHRRGCSSRYSLPSKHGPSSPGRANHRGFGGCRQRDAGLAFGQWQRSHLAGELAQSPISTVGRGNSWLDSISGGQRPLTALRAWRSGPWSQSDRTTTSRLGRPAIRERSSVTAASVAPEASSAPARTKRRLSSPGRLSRAPSIVASAAPGSPPKRKAGSTGISQPEGSGPFQRSS